MKKEHWDEDNIENLFKQAPKVTDKRSKDDVLKRLIDDGAFNEPPQTVDIKAKGIRWMPLIGSIASLFILVVVVNLFTGNSSTSDLALTEISESKEESAMDQSNVATSANRSVQMQEAESFSMTESMAIQTVVYESQLQNMTLFSIGLVGDDAESVPVSFLIPNEIVQEKLGTITPTKLQLYEGFAPLIDEQALGFNEYHPLQGKLREEQSQLVHQLPAEHMYDAGAAALSNYTGVLVDTFGEVYEQVLVQQEDGSPAVLDHIGELTVPLQLADASTQYNYFAYQMRDGMTYLSPNFRMSYSNIEEALQNMTLEANDIYRSAMLPNVTFNVETREKFVVVRFDEMLDLQLHDANAAMRMIESILLTAARFNQQVKFEQIAQDNWGGYDFTKPLEKPIAANLLYFDF